MKENTNIGTNFAKLTAIDVDSGDDHNFFLVNGEGDANNDLFQIDQQTNELVQLPAELSFDPEQE